MRKKRKRKAEERAGEQKFIPNGKGGVGFCPSLPLLWGSSLKICSGGCVPFSAGITSLSRCIDWRIMCLCQEMNCCASFYEMAHGNVKDGIICLISRESIHSTTTPGPPPQGLASTHHCESHDPQGSSGLLDSMDGFSGSIQVFTAAINYLQ
jgi:hypothetical protein